MSNKALILDYDKTLYTVGCRALEELDSRINLFLEEKYGFDHITANQIRLEYHRKYGTTLKGLMENHNLNPHEYFDYIHGIDEVHLPRPNARLNRWLENQDFPIYIFSNARRDWVEMGLHSMGLLDSSRSWLQEIFDIQYCNWDGKPHLSSYKKVQAEILKKYPDCRQMLFADDSLHNLATAKHLNWVTIWIKPALQNSASLSANHNFEKDFKPDFAHEHIVQFNP